MAYNQPIAFFLTSTTYGARLHGDARGSEHKRDGPLEPDAGRVAFHEKQMKGSKVLLDAKSRGATEDGIRALCAKRGWRILALNVRTNHFHIVLVCQYNPDRALAQLKAWATKELRKRGLVGADARVWTERGSARHLFTEKDVNAACEYVANRQGPDLPRE